MLRVKTVWTGIQGTPYFTTHHYAPTTENATAAQDCVDAVKACWDAVRLHVLNGLTYTVRGAVDQLTPAGVLIGRFLVTDRVNNGGSTGEALPFFTQLMSQLRTGIFVGGKEIRGKMYLPGLTETDNTAGGAPSTTLRTDMAIGTTALLNDVANPLAVWSPTNSAVATVSTINVASFWSTVRSRRD